MTPVPLQTIRDYTASAFQGDDITVPEYRGGLIALASLIVARDAIELAQYLTLPVAEVAEVLTRLDDNGFSTPSRLDELTDAETGTAALIVWGQVAAGYVVSVGEHFSLTEHGTRRAESLATRFGGPHKSPQRVQ